MSTWVERVKSRMREIGITQEALANEMGITRAAITHYLAGRRVPPLRQFAKMATILKVEPAWLQFGLSKEEFSLSAKSKEQLSPTSHSLPILSWKDAADPTVNTKKSEFIPHISTDQPHWYGLRVIGDAMTAPGGYTKSFHEGDMIIVDPKKQATHGNFVIALQPQTKEAIFRQYVVDGGIEYLKPLNPQYPLVPVDKRTHIYGVVIRSIRSFD